MQNAGRPGELGRPNDLPNPQKEKRRREVIRKGEDFLLTLKSNSSAKSQDFLWSKLLFASAFAYTLSVGSESYQQSFFQELLMG